jgi:putative flavoprotein involved in K+ transport
MESREAIAAMLDAQLDAVGPTIWRIEGEPVLANCILEAWIRFETKTRVGAGSCGSKRAEAGLC